MFKAFWCTFYYFICFLVQQQTLFLNGKPPPKHRFGSSESLEGSCLNGPYNRQVLEAGHQQYWVWDKVLHQLRKGLLIFNPDVTGFPHVSIPTRVKWIVHPISIWGLVKRSATWDDHWGKPLNRPYFSRNWKSYPWSKLGPLSGILINPPRIKLMLILAILWV